jgi:RNA polymerase sigma factor (sigma-70 family)
MGIARTELLTTADTRPARNAAWARPDDRVILRARAVAGDIDAAYTQLFRAEFAAVTKSVFFIIHDREKAEDVAQDAFVQLLKNWKKVSVYERPDAWVRRVAIRLAVRQVRRDRLLSIIKRDIRTAPEVKARDLDVFACIRQLPAMQRAAIVLFYFEDRPIAQVAEILGCAEATARVHLHRGRKRLAHLLGEGDLDAA